MLTVITIASIVVIALFVLSALRHKSLKRKMKARLGVKNDLDKCVYCGACQKWCEHKAITVSAKMWKCDDSLCSRCIKCIYHCPKKSLSLVNIGV
ncbi:MAG: hypothetical protein LBP89_08160 [Helicobacteraceae bacterium]|jgi:MinD superfamily P-loop ATPase|nr:hypothetical protein [Helicobacteraceae bacterium]